MLIYEPVTIKDTRAIVTFGQAGLRDRPRVEMRPQFAPDLPIFPGASAWLRFDAVICRDAADGRAAYLKQLPSGSKRPTMHPLPTRKHQAEYGVYCRRHQPVIAYP